MSRRDTHAVRSKRSHRKWKPTYKSILNHYAKKRRDTNRIMRGIGTWLPGAIAGALAGHR